LQDIARLKAHYAKYEPTIVELRRKYEVAMKEKMLLSLERDKLRTRTSVLEAQLAGTGSDHVAALGASPSGRQGGATGGRGGSPGADLPSGVLHFRTPNVCCDFYISVVSA
jgi:hypothetical protein